ncbi:MAG: TRAP transporter small permease subunit [Lysobacterales bacterium]
MLNRWADRIEGLLRALERGLGWLLLAMLVSMFVSVLLRYLLPLFGWRFESIALSEAVLVLHSTVFMFGVAVVIGSNQHVRVDLLHARFSARTRALIEFAGSLLLLLPFALLLIVQSFGYVAASFTMRESSQEANGLPAWYLWKALIPLTGVLLLVAALGQLLRAGQTLRTGAADRGGNKP